MGMMLHRHFDTERVKPQDVPAKVGEASPVANLPKTETVAEGSDVPVKKTRSRKKTA